MATSRDVSNRPEDLGEEFSTGEVSGSSEGFRDDRDELNDLAKGLGVYLCEYEDLLEELAAEGRDNRFSVWNAKNKLEKYSSKEKLSFDEVNAVLAASTMYEPDLSGAYRVGEAVWTNRYELDI